MNALQSKTVIGLIVMLALAVGLQLAGKLSPEMVDVIKYIGGFFFSVRTMANYAENKFGGEK